MEMAVIRSRSVIYNGVRFFRTRSANTRVGTFGEKIRPILTGNLIEVDGHIDVTGLNVEMNTVDIDYNRTKRNKFLQNIEGTIKGVEFTGSGDQAWNSVVNEKLKLLHMSITYDDLEDAANRHKSAFNELKYMSRPRIVTDVLVVIEGTMSRKFDRKQKGKITAGKGDIKVSLSYEGSQEGSSTITLQKDMTFAYLLASPDFDSIRRRRRKEIVDLDIDQHLNMEWR